MKLQHLSVIFILIIMPIIIVLSEYMNTKIAIIKTKEIYDEKLLNSTYDAIKGFQMNTINSSLYIPETRVKNIEASVNTFFNSLVTSFAYDGNRKEVMKEYVPAVVFTLYDGYYIYSPFKNTLTNVNDYPDKDDNVDDEVGDDYADNKVLNGLKPHVYYSCRYKINDNNDFIINYTMDNYIAIEGIVGGEYWSSKEHSGYLIVGNERTKCYKWSKRKIK